MNWLGGLEDGETSDMLTSFHFSVVGREINERIEAVAPFVPRGRKLSLICECGDADCEEQVQIAPEQYQQIRRNLQTFIVAPGHHSADSDRVIKSTKHWLLVEKSFDPAGLLAQARRPTLPNDEGQRNDPA